MAVPRSRDDADVQPLEIFDEPVVIERQRAGEIRHAGKRDQADAVVGPFLDEILQHAGRDGEAREFFRRPAHVNRLHGPRQIQHEHDVNARRLGLDVIIRQPRPGQRDDAQRDGQQAEKKQKPSGRRPRLRARRPRDVRAGKRQRRQLARLAAQQRINRQQAEQRQHPRILKFKFAGHACDAWTQRFQSLTRVHAALFGLVRPELRARRFDGVPGGVRGGVDAGEKISVSSQSRRKLGKGCRQVPRRFVRWRRARRKIPPWSIRRAASSNAALT